MKHKPNRSTATTSCRLTKPTNGFLQFLIVQFLVLICCLTLSENSQAQTVAPPLDSYVSNTGGTVTVFVALPDSTTSSEIEVAIGSKNNNGDLFAYTYAFDQTSGLPSGLTYSREGTHLYLGAGAFTLPDAYNVKIRLKDGSGNWSDYYDYISN